MSSHDLRTFALSLPVLLAAMVLHELAHGVVAWRLGDPTAKMLGRLTLNPVRHLDALGTTMFAVTYLGGIAASIPGFAIGWAKPVPVVPDYFRRPQRDMALVAVAGPAVNLAVAAILGAVLFHVPLHGALYDVVTLSLLVNVVLCLFNLLPIPPLDGSRVVGAFLGRDAYARWTSLDRYGVLAIIALVLVFNAQFQSILSGATEGVVRALHAVLG